MSLDVWERFLSACLVYDPPVPGLVEFADKFDFATEGTLEPLGSGPDYGMVAPPIRWMRDPETAESAKAELYWGMIESLIERYIEPQGLNAEDVLQDVLHNTPGLLEGLRKAEAENVARPFIEVRPHHTEEDIRNAFRMIAATHEERKTQAGRSPRDPLLAAECAILHYRYDWKYPQLADRYCWQDENLASKYVRSGREVLKDLG